MALEFTVTEKNFPWSHISPSLKVKLLDQINTNYGHTFLLNPAGFTSHNINRLNFFQTVLPVWRVKQAHLEIQCGNVSVFIFSLTIIGTWEPPGHGGLSFCPNLAKLGPWTSPLDLKEHRCLHLPRGINYTYCSLIFICLRERHIVSKIQLVHYGLRTKINSPQTIPVSNCPIPVPLPRGSYIQTLKRELFLLRSRSCFSAVC